MPTNNVKFTSNKHGVIADVNKLVAEHYKGLEVPFKCPKCSADIAYKDGVNICPSCNAGLDFKLIVE